MSRSSRITAIRFNVDQVWFRVCGYGLWVRWGPRPDLYSTRHTAHYIGPVRWKALGP